MVLNDLRMIVFVMMMEVIMRNFLFQLDRLWLFDFMLDDRLLFDNDWLMVMMNVRYFFVNVFVVFLLHRKMNDDLLLVHIAAHERSMIMRKKLRENYQIEDR